MTIKLLRTLVAIAEEKTFSAAADKVNVTHAAVSQQMQSLEADLGITLFDRSTRTPVLTPLALQIVEKARGIISEYDTLVSSVLDDGGLHGVMTLGVMRTTLTGLVPKAAASLQARFPDLGLHLRPGLTSALMTDIERGTLDAAVVSKPHLLPLGVVFRPLTDEPMQLIAAIDEPLSDPLALLASRPFIRFNRNAVVGALIDNWLVAHRIRVRETMELDSPEAITSMVQANLGVSIVPDLAVKPAEMTPVKRLSLGADAPVRTLGLAYRSAHHKQSALEALWDALNATITRAAK